MLPIPAYIVDLTTRGLLAANRKFVSLLGYKKREELSEILRADCQYRRDFWFLEGPVSESQFHDSEWIYPKKDGSFVSVAVKYRNMVIVPEVNRCPIETQIVVVLASDTPIDSQFREPCMAPLTQSGGDRLGGGEVV